MTNGNSDDANGIDVDGNELWIQLARRDQIFAIHYSLDGEIYKMSRLTHLPMGKTIKVGLIGQAPMGTGGMRDFKEIRLIGTRLKDIRNGNLSSDIF